MVTETEFERRKFLNEQGYWEIPEGLDTSNFDFNWRPFCYEKPYIHQFGTQHQKTSGPKFIVPNNEGIKYQDFQHAIKLPNSSNRCWRPLLSNATFDFSWHPDETEPPYIYVFGNQWYGVDIMPTYQYRVKGATEKKYMYDVKATLLPNKGKWEIPDDINDTGFDYSWVPDPYEPPMNWQFGTQWQKTGGPKFVMKEAIGTKYIDFQKVSKLSNENNRCWRPLVPNSMIDKSWHPDETEPPYIYVFGNQWHDAKTMPTYQYRVKDATEKKYVTDIKAELLPDTENRCWRPLVSNATIDFSWVPNPYDPPYIYVFGNQWYDAITMPTYQYKVKGATEKKYVDTLNAKLLQTSNRMWRPLKAHIDIDTSWLPNPHDPPYIYVFGNQWYSSKEMPTVQYKSPEATQLKYMDLNVAKFKVDVVPYTDSMFDALMNSDTVTDYIQIGEGDIDHVKFMPKPDKKIHVIDSTTAIVPKEAKLEVYDKLQDYQHVVYHSNQTKPKPLDIIFLSNGEKGAEENYKHLLSLIKGLPNNIIGLKDIKGRVASQHEAAIVAGTPWYFLINGKCRVDPNFDFSWQPDRMCTARHYIFRATNPVNGLEYGHMAVVANNKRLTLNTTGKGLDFTLDSPHAIVNVNSGIGVFNTSEWDTWRTAFREVIKLKHNVETINDKASKERLETWLTVANGDYAEWSIKGATDAVEYYESVKGEFEKLKLSYDWEWLRTKFDSYRP